MNEAFSTDQLGRKNFGDRLTAYIGKQKLGTVIAIDAPWGQGKTWFATNWKQDLKEKNHEVVVIDAFHEDYIDDAFILLTRSIVGLLDANFHNRLTKSEFVTMGAKVAVKAAMGGAKGLTENFFGKVIEGATSAAIEEIENLFETAYKKKIEAEKEEQQVFDRFKKALTEIAAKNLEADKPIVIIIDELDRCRPTFAVQIIERIKHFFDVKGLVFVLMINKSQLEAAIKGVYGAETDAGRYLDKFINLSLPLPPLKASQFSNVDQLVKFTEYIATDRYKLNGNTDFNFIIACLVERFDMSLRSIERIYQNFVWSGLQQSKFNAYLFCLKQYDPSFLFDLELNKKNAHERCIKLLRISKDIRGDYHDNLNRYINNLIIVHEFFINNRDDTSIFLEYETDEWRAFKEVLETDCSSCWRDVFKDKIHKINA